MTNEIIPTIDDLIILATIEFLPRTCSRADIDSLDTIIAELHDTATDILLSPLSDELIATLDDDYIDTAAAIILDRLDDPTFKSRLLDIALARYAPSALELTSIDSI